MKTNVLSRIVETFKVQNKDSNTIPALAYLLLLINFYQFPTQCFPLTTWNMLRFIAVEFTEGKLRLTCSLYHKV